MVTRTSAEVADIIERFLDGTGGTWEWDDFCSLTIENRDMEAIRLKCRELSFTHPPLVKGHYCNDEGFLLLRETVKSLRSYQSTRQGPD